ncbi:Uncharacterised protein [uncultured archaeon]|nr:Uncharacterised protein [uncultured archaeon]
MVEIKPFRGLRYSLELKKDLSLLTAPPFDVVSPELRTRLSQKEPHNIVHVDLPQSHEAADRYKEAAERLTSWIKDETIIQEKEPIYYVYEQTFTAHDGITRRRLGLQALIKIEPLGSGSVHPHENTMSTLKEDRLALTEAAKTQLSPVFLIYNDGENAIKPLLEEAAKTTPLYSFKDEEGIINRLYAIQDKEKINTITQTFKEKDLYIADGHHRYETAHMYKQRHPENTLAAYVMVFVVAVEDPGLLVMPYHRLIRTLPMTSDEALQKIRTAFTVHPLPSGMKPEDELEKHKSHHAFVMYFGPHDAHVLTLSKKDAERILPNVPSHLRRLDVTVLHSILLDSILGIKDDVTVGGNITYQHDSKKAIQTVKDGKAQAAILVNSTPADDLIAVAKVNGRMPPKSTFFYPKPRTGMLLYSLKKE